MTIRVAPLNGHQQRAITLTNNMAHGPSPITAPHPNFATSLGRVGFNCLVPMLRRARGASHCSLYRKLDTQSLLFERGRVCVLNQALCRMILKHPRAQAAQMKPSYKAYKWQTKNAAYNYNHYGLGDRPGISTSAGNPASRVTLSSYRKPAQVHFFPLGVADNSLILQMMCSKER